MNMQCRRYLALAVGLALVATAGTSVRAEDKVKHRFVDRVHKDDKGKEHPYVLFVPHDYRGDKPAPLILFLHGAGEREGGTKTPAEVGIGPAIKKYPEKDFPFFVLFPRCDKGSNWGANQESGQRAMAMLAEVQKDYKIDGKRLYLTGLSLGGYGTWSFAAKYPDKWAAIVPICGGVQPGSVEGIVEKIKHIPCWCFHGDADTAVPVARSREMVEALKKAGANPKYAEYPKVGHNSWDKAYGTKELYPWLLAQSLK